MCGWFRQVAARGREGGLGPGACLLLSPCTGGRDGPEERAAGASVAGKAVVLRKGGS